LLMITPKGIAPSKYPISITARIRRAIVMFHPLS
jgi:hypothetical protein